MSGFHLTARSADDHFETSSGGVLGGNYNRFTLHQGGFAGWIGDEKIPAFQYCDGDYGSPGPGMAGGTR